MAVNISIDTSDLDRVLARFGGDILRPPMEKSGALLVAEMARYPAPRGGSTYRRTGQLGRAWAQDLSFGNNSATLTVGNNTSYGPYVQDSERQSRHMTHWQTDEQVAAENESQVVGFFDEYLQDLAN